MRELRSLALVVSRDLKKFIDAKYWLAAQIAMNLADLFIFAMVLRGFIRREFIPDYLKFITPGIVALATFVAAFSIGREVGMEVRRGTVEYLLTLPMKRSTLVFGRVIGGMLRGLVYQVPFVALAFLFASLPPIDRVPALLLTSIALTWSMSSLAIAISTSSRDFNTQATLRAISYYILFFFSNVFYTRKALEYRFPKPLSQAIEYTPISLATDIYRWCFNYYQSIEVEKIVLLIIWCILLTVLASSIYLRNLTKK